MMSWDEGKGYVLKEYFIGKTISCEELSIFLKTMKWDKDKLKVCRVVKLKDRENISKIANTMKYSDSKAKLFEIFF
jgi:hypothetical protein